MSKLKRFEFPDIAAAVTVSNGMNAASVHESSGSEKAQQIAQAFAELPVNTTQRAGRATAARCVVHMQHSLDCSVSLCFLTAADICLANQPAPHHPVSICCHGCSA